MLDKHCQRSPQTGQPGSNQTSQSIFVSSHFHSKKLPVTLCYGAFWNENAYFVYANSVAGSIRPFVAGFQVTGDNTTINLPCIRVQAQACFESLTIEALPADFTN
jgi:hypothetical protein